MANRPRSYVPLCLCAIPRCGYVPIWEGRSRRKSQPRYTGISWVFVPSCLFICLIFALLAFFVIGEYIPIKLVIILSSGRRGDHGPRVKIPFSEADTGWPSSLLSPDNESSLQVSQAYPHKGPHITQHVTTSYRYTTSVSNTRRNRLPPLNPTPQITTWLLLQGSCICIVVYSLIYHLCIVLTIWSIFFATVGFMTKNRCLQDISFYCWRASSYP